MPLYYGVLPRSEGGTGVATTPAAPVAFQPGNPASTTSVTLVMMGLGSACAYTPASSGKIRAGVSFCFATATAAVNMTAAGRYGVAASTTVATGSNGGEISTIASWGSSFGGNGVLDVASISGFPSSGTVYVAASGPTTAVVTYAGTAAGQLTGCAYVSGSATGTVSTGGAVTTVPPNGAAVLGSRFGGAADPLYRFSSLSGSAVLPASYVDLLSLTAGTAYWFDLAVSTSNASDAAAVSNVSMAFVELS
jgi:hypothetical protein